MSKEKQIEEMAKVICGNNKDCKTCVHHFEIRECGCLFYAKRIYDAGYRKQSEGEWVVAKTERAWNCAEYAYMHRCSVCGNEEPSQSLTRFCPNCGAKMKGEKQ